MPDDGLSRRRVLALSSGALASALLPGGAALGQAAAAVPADPAIDGVVERFMAAFETPGIAVAVVRAGRPAYLKGYGVRTLGRRGAVDAHTRFGIASNSKSFTAAALAMLVDEGKLGWDEPVTRYLPEFGMSDPAVTAMFTVRDLLVHRSGLALGAGDLMQFPASDRPPEDALKALPFLKLERGFRSGYAYDNILYVVAGILVGRVSGRPWDRFVQARLLTPLGMADAVPALRFVGERNVAGRHARLGPPIRGLGPVEVVRPDEGPMVDAAGGIHASVTDIARWLEAQLAGGRLPDGRRLWSEAQARELWTPQVITAAGTGPTAENPAASVLGGYALGWGVQDYRGQRLISHSGGLTGQVTQTAMLPGRGAAVAVFSNIEDGVSRGIRNALLDQVLGAPAFDWVASFRGQRDRMAAEAVAAVGGAGMTPPAGGPSLPFAAYTGRFRDPWYGDVVVAERRGRLNIRFEPTPVFRSVLEPWGTDTFRTRFPRGAGEDALVTFVVKDGRVPAIRMKAFSPMADFSYDFQHLDLTRVA